jgi:type II secretory pathway pseudopilin PulG
MPRNPPGHTLLELAVVLALASVATTALTPAARRYRNRAAVLAAREVTVGHIAEARLAAMATGRARVAIEATTSLVRSMVGDSVVSSTDLSADLGVSVEWNGARATTEIDFNALGIGVFASETVLFRRGDEVATLVVSSLGRATRR